MLKNLVPEKLASDLNSDSELAGILYKTGTEYETYIRFKFQYAIENSVKNSYTWSRSPG